MREHYINPSDKTLLTILNDNVCEGTITGVIFQNFDGHFLVDGYRFKHNGELFTLPYDQEFFKNEDALKRSIRIEPERNDKRFDLISTHHKADVTQYYLKAGKAEPWQLNQNVNRYLLGQNCKIENIDGFVPEKLYDSEEQFYLHNDLIIHKDNGDIEIQDAPIKKILLNDKQKELFERFKSLVKEMDEANMVIMSKFCDDSIGVINRPSSGNEWAGTYNEPNSVNFWDSLPNEQYWPYPANIWSVSEEWEITL